MIIEIPDKMYARLVILASGQTCDENDEEYSPDYHDGVDDGKIILARTFLDEVVITYDV